MSGEKSLLTRVIRVFKLTKVVDDSNLTRVEQIANLSVQYIPLERSTYMVNFSWTKPRTL